MPPPLHELMEEPSYSRLKALFIERRRSFKANPDAIVDLEAYTRGDNTHNYTVLKGLIPKALVGNASAGGGIAYTKSDTFFTEFTKHHPESYVLSSSDVSLIIGNRASHDIRQYSPKCDPENKDTSASAGMSYMHFMVIPKRKVYNAVALDDVDLIEEMISHFKTFWTIPGSVQKSIDRIQLAIDTRAGEVLKGFEKNPETAAKRTAEFSGIMADVQKSADEFAIKLATLTAEDFVFAFHPAPDASVAHLHMHVLAVPSELRQYSTSAHDWKTIPARAVMDVICEEKTGGMQTKIAIEEKGNRMWCCGCR